MTVRDIQRLLDCEVICGDDLVDAEVASGCGADLMSDVLRFIKPNGVLLTGLTPASAIRAAEMTGVRAIVYVRGKQPEEEAVSLARKRGIPLLTTQLLMFESCGRLHAAGLRGGSECKEG